MKLVKVLLLNALIAAYGMLAAQSITVVSPPAGTDWKTGSSQQITWTYSGLPDSTKIVLILWRNNVKVGSITQQVPIGSSGQGSHPWTVNTFQDSPGTGYSIKVRNAENTVSAVSGSFTISAPASTGLGSSLALAKLAKKMPPITHAIKTIVVTSPKSGDSLSPYDTLYVNWNKFGAMDAHVQIALLRNGALAATLAASAANSGGFSQNLALLPPPDPGTYTIRVKTLDNTLQDESEPFAISESGSILVLSPKGGEVWESGTVHEVAWERLGNVQKLDIKLVREGVTVATMAQDVDAKLGSKSLAFTRQSTDTNAASCYLVKITHSGTSSTNPSGCFTLTGNPDLAVTTTYSPAWVSLGASLTFTIRVENKGMGRSTACQGELRFNDELQKSFAVAAIDPGASISATVVWTLPSPGTVKIVVDGSGMNIEPDKANNSWTNKFF